MLSVYEGDTFKIVLQRYSDTDRKNSARNSAIYLGKTDRDNIRRPLSIIRMGHVKEVFRGEMAEFEFVDCSKEVYDHLTTYRTLNMRVAGGNRALTSNNFTMPSDRMHNPKMVRWMIEKSMANYETLLEQGETPQISRSAMPIAAKLNPFVLQFNFVTLMDAVFTQRIWERGAQGNTVKVVLGMWELVREQDPELWDLVREVNGEEAHAWKQVRKKLKKENPELLEELLGKYGQVKSMWD